LELHREEIEAAGLRAVAVGLGRPQHARHFGARLAPSVTCVTTEKPTLHSGYGVGRGSTLRMVAPDAIVAGARAAARGHTQGASTGDTLRLPATLIIDGSGVVRRAHYGKHAGDQPDLGQWLRDWAEEEGQRDAGDPS
jgi:hypothetical protein